MKRNLRLAIVLAAFALSGFAALSQQGLDRTKIPTPGRAPALRVPSWTKTTLANGSELIVSEKHDLPLVAVTITFLGGTYQAETASRRGVASMTATMLSEGTKTRDGEALSSALQLLGTSINVNVGGES